MPFYPTDPNSGNDSTYNLLSSKLSSLYARATAVAAPPTVAPVIDDKPKSDDDLVMFDDVDCVFHEDMATYHERIHWARNRDARYMLDKFDQERAMRARNKESRDRYRAKYEDEAKKAETLNKA